MHGLFLLVYEVFDAALVMWGVKFGGVMVVEWFSFLRICDKGVCFGVSGCVVVVVGIGVRGVLVGEYMGCC